MTSLIRALGFLLVLAFLGLFWQLHLNPKNALHGVTYAELKVRYENHAHLVETLKKRTPGVPEDDEIRKRMVASGERDASLMHREILLRQLSMVVAAAGGFCFLLSLGMGLFKTTTGARHPKASRGSARRYRHKGKITVEPSKVEYIDGDDLQRRLTTGYGDQDDAEMWLRGDDFLICPTCNTDADVDTIGSVQEVTLFEDVKGQSGKEGLNQLGVIWNVRSIDRYLCKRCQKQQVRTAR